ncbi:hypothetical protein SK128_021386, partial [Halocaridina rubra]
PELTEIDMYVTSNDLQRLEAFLRHQCEAPLIADIIPGLSRLYFSNKIASFKLKAVQA